MHEALGDHGVGVDRRVGCKAVALSLSGGDDTCSDGVAIFLRHWFLYHVELDRMYL